MAGPSTRDERSGVGIPHLDLRGLRGRVDAGDESHGPIVTHIVDAPPWPAGHDAAGQTERTHGCSSEWSVWGAWEQGSSAG